VLTLLFAHLVAAADTNYLTAAVRHSVAVPTNVVGIANNSSVEVGVTIVARQAFGVRFVVVPDPPAVYGEETPTIAFGPSVYWAWYGKLSSHIDVYPTGAMGFVVGQRPMGWPVNKVLPMFQAGVGMRFHSKVGKVELYATPEIGFVPLIVAPYFGIGVGLMAPTKQD
jgi:hypothetical protein